MTSDSEPSHVPYLFLRCNRSLPITEQQWFGPWEANGLLQNGAQETTRTSTPLRAPAPEAGASTNSATWAQESELSVGGGA